MTFYERFRELAAMRGLTPTRACEECGLNKGTVSAWKQRGTHPTGNTLQKIAEYFGVSTDYLLTGKESQMVIETFDPDARIFEAINALKDENIRRIVLKLRRATSEEVSKVIGMLDVMGIGGSVDA